MGVGFDRSCSGAAGFGLSSMRECAAHIGGELHVESAPGSGTLIRVEVPQ